MDVLRIFGIGLVIAALTAGVISATQTAEPWDITGKSLGDVWAMTRPQSLESVRTAVHDHLPPAVGNPGLKTLLAVPVWIVVGLLGFALIRFGRRGERAALKQEAETEIPGSATSSKLRGSQTSSRSELAEALSSCRSAFVSIGLFSGMINVLMLTGAFFMLQIYDRVLPSRSVPTLVALAILVGVLFAFLAILDMIRNRMLVRIGGSLDQALSGRV